MNTALIHLFDETVRRGSFAGAARALELDPSAVSRGIATLESTLGIRLFERTTRKIAITEAGAAYHARIAPLLSDLDAAADAARDLVDTPRGQLRVSASTAFGQHVMLPMLPAFRRACPDVTLDLILSDQQLDLIENRIDLAIRLAPDAPPDTVISRLMPTRYRVVATPGYLADHPIAQPANLADHDCLLFPFPGFRDRWRFRRRGKEEKVPVQGAVQIAGAMALREAALMGLGPALLADWLISEDLAARRLVDPFPDWEAAATSFDTAAWLLYPSRAYQPLKTRRFIETLRAHVAGA